MDLPKCLKAGIAVVGVLVTFFFTGWVLNWAPLSNMLENGGFYEELCEGLIGCHEQQVAIAKLWSAIMLSEFTIFPSGVLMDCMGPIFFTLCAGFVHCVSTIAVIMMPRNSPLLVVPFFGCGTAAHASALLAMRTVFVFDTPKGRSRWILVCCTVFDSSAICTMIYYNLWQGNIISIDDVFRSLAILGLVLFGSLFLLYSSFKHYRRAKSGISSLEEPLIEDPGSCIKGKKELKKKELTLDQVITSPSFYFIIFYSFISIFRIRYFLGIANYTLKRLHDNGFYLEALGYCFCLTAIFTPLVDRILSAIKNVWTQFHLVNGLITLFIFTWLIPNLPVQLLTFSLFVFARLMFFVILNDYITREFSEKWFGMIMGLGFVAAAIPGTFTYLIVEVGLKKFGGNFWVFHLGCIVMAIPTTGAVSLMRRYRNRNEKGLNLMIQHANLDRSGSVMSRGLLD